MNEQFQQLVQRFRSFPRVVQWVVLAGIAAVLLLVWNDYIYALGQDWKTRGDDIMAQVEEVRDAESLERRFESMEDVIITLGAVEVPGSEQQASDALSRAINTVISKYKSDISGESFNRGRGDSMRKGSLPGIIGPGMRGQKISLELSFESGVETAMNVIADLEASPHIEAVTEVRLAKSGNRKVKVRLQLEAWVITRDTGRGRT